MVRVLWLTGLIATLAKAQLNATVEFETSAAMIAELDMLLAVIPEVLVDTSLLLNTTGLQARQNWIDVVVAASTVATTGLTAVVADNVAVTLYDNIAAKIKAKSDANSCTLTYGTDSDDGYYEGYAYEATTTGSNWDTTAILAKIETAVQKCATKLNMAGVVRGCCQFSYGGTWTGHLRLTANPSSYPATSVTC